MNETAERFGHAVKRLPRATEKLFTGARPDFVEWLSKNRVPQQTVDLFSKYWLAGEEQIEIGFANFWPESLIRIFHDETPEYFGAGWLIVASMPNGDFVVSNIQDPVGVISYVSHEEIWAEPNHVRDDLHAICVRVADSLGEFLERVIDDEVPVDYFEAVEP